MLLLTQLAIASSMVALTVAIHLAGLAVLIFLLRHHQTRVGRLSPLVRDGIGILSAVFGLFLLHALEIWSYAALYWLSGELSDFEPALYFSTSSYATIGYGDVVLGRAWRLVGAIEGANGVILRGWATAFFVAVVSRRRFLERGFEGRDHDRR